VLREIEAWGRKPSRHQLPHRAEAHGGTTDASGRAWAWVRGITGEADLNKGYRRSARTIVFAHRNAAGTSSAITGARVSRSSFQKKRRDSGTDKFLEFSLADAVSNELAPRAARSSCGPLRKIAKYQGGKWNPRQAGGPRHMSYQPCVRGFTKRVAIAFA